jgi:hypothetical protein
MAVTLTRRTLAVALAALPGVATAAPARSIQFWATQRGGQTLDSNSDGVPGNPFATELIALMAQPNLDLGALATALRERTRQRSDAFQTPEIVGDYAGAQFSFTPAARGRRAALVLIFSKYSGGAPSLPGAAYDGDRIHRALKAANFDATLIVDPSRAEWPGVFSAFAAKSAKADVAALYVTGHGVEVGGVQYVIPGDFPMAAGAKGLNRAIAWTDVAAVACAKRLNLTLWAGCRDNPFS